jgi:hypothetical protein
VVPATVIVDAVSGSVLAYERTGPHTVLKSAASLLTWYDDDGSTRAQAEFGSAFMLSNVFQTGNPAAEFWYDVDLFSDFPSYLMSLVFQNRSELLEPGKLGIAVERAYQILFSQFAAMPDLVFVEADAPELIRGVEVVNETRIVVSTTAMVVVVTILSVLLVALTLLQFWTERLRDPSSPLSRQPDSLGASLQYLAYSDDLLALFDDQAISSENQLVQYLKSLKKTYKTETITRNGIPHPIIEVTENLWVKGRVPWTGRSPDMDN